MSTEKSRILIADDNGPNVELLEAYLSGLDCEIGIAVDGRLECRQRCQTVREETATFERRRDLCMNDCLIAVAGRSE